MIKEGINFNSSRINSYTSSHISCHQKIHLLFPELFQSLHNDHNLREEIIVKNIRSSKSFQPEIKKNVTIIVSRKCHITSKGTKEPKYKNNNAEQDKQHTSRRWAWVRFPWSSAAFNPANPNIIFNLCAACFVPLHINRTNYWVVTDSTMKNERIIHKQCKWRIRPKLSNRRYFSIW